MKDFQRTPIERTGDVSARRLRQRGGRLRTLGLAALFLGLAAQAAPPPQQGQGKIAQPAAGAQESPTPLASLVAEAEKNSPEVIAALRGWQAAEQVPSQVSTLPDPQVMVQHVSAGTPIPGWNFNTVPMTFVGVGVSQDIPFPGKLPLRGEEARRQAGAMQEKWELAKRTVAEQVKITYYRLSDVQKTLDLLARDQKLIRQIEEIAEARYRLGQGNQQDVLKAQLEETRLVRDVTEYQEQRGSLEAQLKQILNRPPESADIVVATLVETPLPFSSNELLSLVPTGNLEVTAEQQVVRSRAVGVQVARKDFYPDFSFQYMYEQTGTETPNRYALTFGVKIPIYRSHRQEPELAQAAATLDQARRQYEGQVQQAYFEVQDQYLTADADSKVLKIYMQGLIPQATATFQAGLAAYQSGREDFQTLLDSFLDVLNLDTEYWRTLADHESALARLEQLTGISLP